MKDPPGKQALRSEWSLALARDHSREALPVKSSQVISWAIAKHMSGGLLSMWTFAFTIDSLPGPQVPQALQGNFQEPTTRVSKPSIQG